jgi:hypothetical protein
MFRPLGGHLQAIKVHKDKSIIVSYCIFLYFLTLALVSVMHVIYTPKEMLKKFGVRVIYRKIR